MRHVCLLAIGFLVLLSSSWTSSAADFAKPGPYAFALQQFSVPDVSGNRPLSTWVWYPVSKDGTGAGQQARADTPTAKDPFPLVVLIHGLSGRAMGYSRWGQHLATYGFVVAAANFDDGQTAPPDPGVSLGDKAPRLLLYDRPANVVQLIKFADVLTSSEGRLAGLIDTSRVGVWGHSTGGTTALQAGGARIDFPELVAWCAENDSEAYGESCQFVGHERAIGEAYDVTDPLGGMLPPKWDHRVAALVLAAPGGELHAFGQAGLAAVEVPTLIMVAADDGVVKPQTNALWAYPAISSEDKSLAVFDHGGHSIFLRFGPSTDETMALTTAFFLDILKGDPSARAARQFAEVNFSGLAYKTTLKSSSE